MQEQDGLTPQQQKLELALKSLSPAVGRIDPISAAFSAGRQSSQGQIVWLRSVTALCLVAGTISWLLPVKNPAIRRIDVVQFVAQTIPVTTPPQPMSAQSLVMLQNAVRDKGLDGLPASKLPEIQVVRAGDMF
jgi:hypothetical protein